MQGVTQAVTPKTACTFSNPLCAWQSRYVFGAAERGGTVYYLGGLDANDPTYPLSGSQLETFDVATMSPRVLQTFDDPQLNTSRYRQQMAFWAKDKLVMAGGQHDDINGASARTLNVVVLDLNTRRWKLRRGFKQSNGGAEIFPDSERTWSSHTF